MSLVAPLDPAVEPAVADLARLFGQTLGFVPNSVLTMQRRPAIAKAFTELNRAVMENHGRVTSELKRLVGLVASAAVGCRYCEAHTALAATRFGASPERLAAVWEHRTSPLFTDGERAALDFALAAASVPNAVTPALSAEMRRHWDDGEIVEILGVVALFGYLNRWNDTMGTTLEAPAAAEGERHLSGRGWNAGKHG
jgi:uncharacterized peroxidase-related enzyme